MRHVHALPARTRSPEFEISTSRRECTKKCHGFIIAKWMCTNCFGPMDHAKTWQVWHAGARRGRLCRLHTTSHGASSNARHTYVDATNLSAALHTRCLLHGHLAPQVGLRLRRGLGQASILSRECAFGVEFGQASILSRDQASFLSRESAFGVDFGQASILSRECAFIVASTFPSLSDV